MSDLNFKELSAFETPNQSPGFLLWHISTSWRGSIEQTLKLLDLTHPQFVVLATLAWLTKEGNRVTQAAVGKMAGLDPNTVSQIIKGLEKKKLISRKSSSDARAKNPILTKKGSEVLQKALPAVETKDAEFFRKLSKNESDCLMGLFQKLISKN